MWRKAEKFLSKDKYIGPLIKKYGSCKIKPGKKKDYFLDLVDAICSQQLSGRVAVIIFGRVKDGLGELTPEKILRIKDEKFRKWGLSRQKTVYIKDLATKIKNGQLKISKLDKLSDEEVMKELISVKGIGTWTAKMFLMFSLGRPDVFPHEDLGIRISTKKILKKKIEGHKLENFSLRWKPYRTIASWYLWEFLENK